MANHKMSYDENGQLKIGDVVLEKGWLEKLTNHARLTTKVNDWVSRADSSKLELLLAFTKLIDNLDSKSKILAILKSHNTPS